MVKFRAAIRAHLRTELRHARGPPLPDIAAEVTALLDLFCGGTAIVSNIKRPIIQTLVNGDPYGTDAVHHCRGCCAGYEDCLAKFEASQGTFLDVGHVIDGEVMNSLWTTLV